jgi:hypothetical protein
MPSAKIVLNVTQVKQFFSSVVNSSDIGQGWEENTNESAKEVTSEALSDFLILSFTPPMLTPSQTCLSGHPKQVLLSSLTILFSKRGR